MLKDDNKSVKKNSRYAITLISLFFPQNRTTCGNRFSRNLVNGILQIVIFFSKDFGMNYALNKLTTINAKACELRFRCYGFFSFADY